MSITVNEVSLLALLDAAGDRIATLAAERNALRDDCRRNDEIVAIQRAALERAHSARNEAIDDRAQLACEADDLKARIGDLERERDAMQARALLAENALDAAPRPHLAALYHDCNVAEERAKDLHGRLANAAARIADLEAQLADVTPPAPTWDQVQAMIEAADLYSIKRFSVGQGYQLARVNGGGVWSAPTLADAVAKMEAAQ